MKISVIISTYNQPGWLEKVLWGYECQTHNDFEIVIADDGSREDTREVIEKFRRESELDINHIWHEDAGYRKCEILNKAIIASTADYLLFTDGDCIPRRDFVEQHVYHAEEGYFLSGGAVRLPLETSMMIGREDILSQRAFSKSWLTERGLKKNFLKNLKLNRNRSLAAFLNHVTPANATWNGGNASGWKSDIISVNGFDQRLGYGGQDREFGERLFNMGIRSKQLRYTLICIHLDHSRGYAYPDAIKKNLMIRQETRREKKIITEYGIVNKLE